MLLETKTDLPAVVDVLNIGQENAIKLSNLAKFYNINPRALTKRIEWERKQGAPILAQRYNGGGYYLPSCAEELKKFFNWRKQEVIGILETVQSMKNQEKTPLPKDLQSMIEAL